MNFQLRTQSLNFKKLLKLLLSSILFMACFTFVAYKSWQCVDKYLQRIRSIDISYAKQTEVEFPSFTMCPYYYTETPSSGPEAYKSAILQECNTTALEMEDGWFYGSKQCSADYLFENVHPSLEDFEIKGFEIWSADGANFINMSIEDPRISWRPSWYLSGYGQCYTFSLSQNVTQANEGIGDITMFLGFKQFLLYIHSMGKLVGWPDYSIGVKGFNVLPGKYTEVKMDMMEYMEYLDHTEDGICNGSKRYFQDVCFTELVRSDSMTKYGCQIPYGPWSPYHQLCTNRDTTYNAYEVFENDLHNTTACKNQCKFLMNALTSQTVTDNNETLVNLVFKDQVKKSTSRITYGGLELLAEVGGYVGLFLGLSVFHISIGFAKLLEKISGL